jgi:hypothetical protein
VQLEARQNKAVRAERRPLGAGLSQGIEAEPAVVTHLPVVRVEERGETFLQRARVVGDVVRLQVRHPDGSDTATAITPGPVQPREKRLLPQPPQRFQAPYGDRETNYPLGPVRDASRLR